jgi:hypothetical protein
MAEISANSSISQPVFVPLCLTVGGGSPSKFPICHRKAGGRRRDYTLDFRPLYDVPISPYESQKAADAAMSRPIFCLLWAAIIVISTGCIRSIKIHID